MSHNNSLKTRIAIEHSIYTQEYRLYLAMHNTVTHAVSLARPLTLDTHEQAEGMSFRQEPFLTVSDGDNQCFQQFMDDLWNLGFRPSNLKANSEQIGALQNHLSDMRTIAFAELGIHQEEDFRNCG